MFIVHVFSLCTCIFIFIGGVRVASFGSTVFPPSGYRQGMNTDELEPPQADLNVEWMFGYGGVVASGGGSRASKLQPGAELFELQSQGKTNFLF